MCVFSATSRMVRALRGMALVLLGVGAAAQAQQVHFTLNGVDYELVTWPGQSTTDAPVSLTSNTWSAGFGGGKIEVSADGGLHSDPNVMVDFFDTTMHQSAGYAIAPTPQFRVNKGQKSGVSRDDMLTTYTITAQKLPTELIFYAGSAALPTGGGDASSGLKYASWQWGSTQVGTEFEVLARTTSANGSFDVLDNDTSTMSWRSFGADNNNKGMALVRITNPAGISNFSVSSNRLKVDGSPGDSYTEGRQRADFSGMAILVRKPAAAVSPQAIPTLGAGALVLLLAAFSGIGAWVLRHRGGTWRRMNVGAR